MAEPSERERVEALVGGAMGDEHRVGAEKRGESGGVAAVGDAALAVEDEAVEGRVGGEDGALAEDVGGEHGPVLRHALEDEELRVGKPVHGEQPQGLPNQRQTRAARGQTRFFLQLHAR